MVVLKHNINTLINHPKYASRAFSQTTDKRNGANSRVIFLITELVTTLENFQLPDDIIFEYVERLENFRLKVLENYHKYLHT